MNSNTVDFVNSADQTFVETVVQTVLPAETKKKPVLKTIPKKIMGYLKFASFVLGANDDTIVSKLFLDKSIEEIVAIVYDVVENGNQDKTIQHLRKQILNPPKVKKTKKTKKTDNADAIVTDLVTLARTHDTPAVPKKTRAKPVKSDTETETPVVEKKVRSKKTKAPIVSEAIVDTISETIAQTPVETIAQTPVEPVKKSRTKKTEPNAKKAAPVQTQIKASLIAHQNEVAHQNEASEWSTTGCNPYRFGFSHHTQCT